jgi:hypothetical protein
VNRLLATADRKGSPNLKNALALGCASRTVVKPVPPSTGSKSHVAVTANGLSVFNTSR